ncbi:MAG TPA: exonuclease SbcCD subunit D [Jatrophihabitans sp.]|jgi:exonuclease SbcD
MRFLHTSDWHLGRTLHGVDLLDAQRTVLGEICRLVSDPLDGIAVDAVIVAGDVYDRAVPPVEAVTLLADVLAELTRHTTVIVTAGNHDSAIRLGFGSRLFTERLHIRTALDGVGLPVMVSDVAVYPLPYLDPDAARTVLSPDDTPLARSHQAVMSAAMHRVRQDLAARPAGTRSVVVAHAFVVGGAVSDSERSIAVGGVDSIAADTFDGIDYVALGHLHGAQQPRSSGATVLGYSGSPLRYSFSEREHAKSASLVDLAADGTVTITASALTQPRPMAELVGELEHLLADPALEAHTGDWLRITVTDRSRPEQLFDRIKSRFPHILQVLHIPTGLGEIGAQGRVEIGSLTPRELAADFIEHVTGVMADDRELALFERAFAEATAELGSAR